MNLRHRLGLIPRNNWDYGLRSLFVALAAARKPDVQTPNIASIFPQKPLWTTSGRASLFAILSALELPQGASVGVPLFCCPVVFDAIRQAGFSPRFLDSKRDDPNVSADDLRRKRAGLAAVIAVHMFGNPCDVEAIVAAANPIPVIEDCAQSIFSTYMGRPTGLLGTASFFSFRCGKYLSAGEGSAILCKDAQLRERVARTVASFQRWSASGVVVDAMLAFAKATLYHRPWYGLAGYPLGMRLDKTLNLTAKDGFETARIAPGYLALADARSAHFEEKIDVQRRHAQFLLETVLPAGFDLPSESKDCASNWFQFALRFEDKGQRDRMADYLFHCGIDTSKYADKVPEQARANYGYGGDCPNAEQLSRTILLVPIHYTLRADDMAHIARSINNGSHITGKSEGRDSAKSRTWQTQRLQKSGENY